MRSSFRLTALVPFLLALAATTVGCAEPSVEEARRKYSAEVTHFVVTTPTAAPSPVEPPPDDAAIDSVDGEGTTAPPPDGGDNMAEDMADDIEVEDLNEADANDDVTAPGPQPVDVMLDIILTHEGGKKLDGITLDIFQGSPDGDQKGHWTAWVDTSDMVGREKRVAHTVKDVLYVQGDGFAAEVAHTVPEEERSEYRELAGGAGN
jgi:hypothetical protein